MQTGAWKCARCGKPASRSWGKKRGETLCVPCTPKLRTIKAIVQNKRNIAIQRRAPWFDARLVKDIYALAQVHREAGLDCEVDHMVPLVSERVSGLHVQNNLRVVLTDTNRLKRNTRWPDMAPLYG